MQVNELIHGVGSVGPFQSRVFIPALATALILRFGPEVQFINDTGILQELAGGDLKKLSWFTSDLMLGILGVLSLLEVAATKNPEAASLLGEVEPYLKPGMATLTYMGFVSAVDAQKISEVLEVAPQAAGVVDLVPALAVGAATFVTVTLRRGATQELLEADPDDDTGVQGLISWANDVWAFFGVWLLVLVPLLIVAITGGLVLLFYWFKRRAEKKDEQSKAPCPGCDEPVYACAMACGQCGHEVEQPRRIGFFGQSLAEPIQNRDDHPYRLTEKKRCPVCATRLTQRDPRQTCPACAHRLMQDPAFAQRYAQRVTNRLPLVLLVCAGLSLIPIVGLIPGVIVYRVTIVGPFRRYVPRLRNLFTRWGIRLLFIILAIVQIMPGINAIVVPIMALVNYGAYRSQFQRMLDRTPPPPPDRGTTAATPTVPAAG